MSTQICPICLKEFIKTFGNQKYCCTVCAKKARKTKQIIYHHAYYIKDTTKHKKLRTIYRATHREETRIYGNMYKKQRIQKDPIFKLLCNLRTRISNSIKRNSKALHTMELIGCTIEYLKAYLESLFKPEMT